MNAPFFSVILPVYNRPKMAIDAISSILAQTFTDYEIIVVDDGSTDETCENIRCWSRDGLKLLTQSNAGPGVARNTGITHARGRFITFLDADDLWLPWTLKTFHEILTAENNPAFVAGAILEFRGEPPKITGLNQPLRTARHKDLFSVPVNPFHNFNPPSVAVSAGLLREAGAFAANRMNYEDIDLWLRLGTAPGFVYIESPPLLLRRWHDGNVSADHDQNLRGAMHIVSAEKNGSYPGGVARRKDRLRLLSGLFRAASLDFARRGQPAAALSLYRGTFAWNLADLRLKYLLGLPAIAMLHSFRG